MLATTYEKVNQLFENANGYLATKELLDNKITTIQLRKMLEEGKIQKVSFGNYWNCMSGRQKPKHYKMLEACLTNRRAVICALSACYYHGLLEEEPDKLYVATARNDRSRMTLNFPVSRHYFAVASFDNDIVEVDIAGKKVRIYDIDRSVCDCIRLEKEIGKEKVELIVERYKNYKERNQDRLLSYADKMRVGKIVRQYVK